MGRELVNTDLVREDLFFPPPPQVVLLLVAYHIFPACFVARKKVIKKQKPLSLTICVGLQATKSGGESRQEHPGR